MPALTARRPRHRPLLVLAATVVLGLTGPAAWRWFRRTSRTQVHRVNQ